MLIAFAMPINAGQTGQTITIENRTVDGDVAGNGSGADGTAPFDGNPNNNILNVTSNGVVHGHAFGADAGDADVTNNAVFGLEAVS